VKVRVEWQWGELAHFPSRDYQSEGRFALIVAKGGNKWQKHLAIQLHISAGCPKARQQYSGQFP
jgi:hypothetical protein